MQGTFDRHNFIFINGSFNLTLYSGLNIVQEKEIVFVFDIWCPSMLRTITPNILNGYYEFCVVRVIFIFCRMKEYSCSFHTKPKLLCYLEVYFSDLCYPYSRLPNNRGPPFTDFCEFAPNSRLLRTILVINGGSGKYPSFFINNLAHFLLNKWFLGQIKWSFVI